MTSLNHWTSRYCTYCILTIGPTWPLSSNKEYYLPCKHTTCAMQPASLVTTSSTAVVQECLRRGWCRRVVEVVDGEVIVVHCWQSRCTTSTGNRGGSAEVVGAFWGLLTCRARDVCGATVLWGLECTRWPLTEEGVLCSSWEGGR